MKFNSILFIGNRIDEGGAGKIMKSLANICLNHFDSVSIYSYEQKTRPLNIDKSVNFYNSNICPTYSYWWRILVIKDIRRIVKQMKPDLVFSFTSEVSFMARVATLGVKCVFISAERGDPYTFPLRWVMLTKWVYSHSDACFFQLKRARDFYSRRVIEKSYIIPNHFFLPSAVEPYYGIRNKTIVSAGRFVPEKGFDILIKAFNEVHKKHNDYKLILFGDGPLKEHYQRMVEHYNLIRFVEFPGRVSNVAECVQKEGIFVLSSYLEGIPNVLIEALSVGIPTVSTNCEPGGPAFLSDNGKRGLLVPIGDFKAISEAIIKLIEDKSLYEKLEKKGPDIRKVLDQNLIFNMWYRAFDEIDKKCNNK